MVTNTPTRILVLTSKRLMSPGGQGSYSGLSPGHDFYRPYLGQVPSPGRCCALIGQAWVTCSPWRHGLAPTLTIWTESGGGVTSPEEMLALRCCYQTGEGRSADKKNRCPLHTPTQTDRMPNFIFITEMYVGYLWCDSPPPPNCKLKGTGGPFSSL